MALGPRALTTIGAVAAAALIAFLLLPGRAGDGGAAGPTGASARPASEAPAAVAPTTRAEAAALAEHDPPAPDPPPADEGAAVEVRVLLGGVQPVPGCLVMSADRREDGGFDAGDGDDCADPGVTDDEGIFVLRWVNEPKERLLTISIRGGKVERVEGATQVSVRSAGQLVLLAGSAPVTVHLQDGGVPRVRILDAATGLPVSPDTGAVIEYSHPGSPGEKAGAVVRRPLTHEAAGWWALRRVPGEAVGPRVRAAGYRDAPLEDWNGTGRRVVRLTPSDTGVKGILEPLESAPLLAVVSIRRVGSRAALRSPTLARVCSNQLFVDGLEEGEWEIDAQWQSRGNSSGTDAWTVRRFEYQGGLLDLGALHAAAGVTLIVRWASPVALPPGASLALRAVREDAVVDADDAPSLRDDPTVDADEDGLFQFRGLRPGGEYRLRCGRFPGYEETVRAPAEPGATAGHEAGRDLRLVKCRLTFTVDGKKPAGPVSLDGPLEDAEFDPDRVLVETRLVPGRHRFRARVAYANSGILPRHTSHESEVEVPDRAEFEATVELRRVADD